MNESFCVIHQLSEDPPTFVRDNLTWIFYAPEEDGIPYKLERNDSAPPSADDHEMAQRSTRFILAPHYGPIQ